MIVNEDELNPHQESSSSSELNELNRREIEKAEQMMKRWN